MRYKNTIPQPAIGPAKILRWKLGGAPRDSAPKPRARIADIPFPTPDPDWEALHHPKPQEIQVTWVGHSTFLIQHEGRNLLTDPIFGDCQTPIPGIRLRRISPPGLRVDQLPPIHDVLISHNHYDHLDAPSVQRLANLSADTRFWLPAGLSAWFRKRGIDNVQELAWWKSKQLAGGGELHCLPAQHFSARGPFDRDRTHWCGWALRSGGQKIYYAGDTGYNQEFKEIGRVFDGMDVALIPIGAYDPRWIMQPVHTDPFEAVKIHEDVRSRRSIGCHWGTFRLTEEPWNEPPELLQRALAERGLTDKDFGVLVPGQSIALPTDRDSRFPQTDPLFPQRNQPTNQLPIKS